MYYAQLPDPSFRASDLIWRSGKKSGAYLFYQRRILTVACTSMYLCHGQIPSLSRIWSYLVCLERVGVPSAHKTISPEARVFQFYTKILGACELSLFTSPLSYFDFIKKALIGKRVPWKIWKIWEQSACCIWNWLFPVSCCLCCHKIFIVKIPVITVILL